MQPRAGEGLHPCVRLGLGRLVGVVRERQVGSADMKIDGRPERRQGHGRALRVPARTTRAPWARPCRLVAYRPLPQRRVERVVLVRIIRMATVLAGQLGGALSAQATTDRDFGAAVVHRTVAHVGLIEVNELERERDDLLDVIAAAGLERRAHDAERGHVPFEAICLLDRERTPGHAVPTSLHQQVIVDIGDVAAYLHGRAGQAQHTRRDVRPDERGRMPDMSGLVWGDAAHVDPRGAQHGQSLRPYPRHGSRAEMRVC